LREPDHDRHGVGVAAAHGYGNSHHLGIDERNAQRDSARQRLGDAMPVAHRDLEPCLNG